MPLLSLVIPTYNERDAVGPLLGRVLAAADGAGIDLEVLVVDDDSPDGTADRARAALGARGRVIVRKGERGLASAALAGFREAKGEILGLMDADGSHPPERISDLLAPLSEGRADLVIASRYVAGGGVAGWPLPRRAASRAANLLARAVTPVRDATSGFFFLRRDLLERLDGPPAGFKIGLELFVRCRDLRIVEVPYLFTDRTAGKSKFGPGAVLAYLGQLASLIRYRATTKS